MPIDFNPDPPKYKFWVIGDARGTGAGKTTQLIDMMCYYMDKDPDYRVVLAVPTHRLGEEIKTRFTDRGFEAAVFYGREAKDPAAKGKKMCLDLERTKTINGALGDVSKMACKKGQDECPFYQTCGYQAQQRLTPRVWIVAHNLIFRARPKFIPQPDFVGIDEAFAGASLNGFGRDEKIVTLDALEKLREVPKSNRQGSEIDYDATADLKALSDKVTQALRTEMSGRVRKEVLDNFSSDELRDAYRLEWKRKIELDIIPGMQPGRVASICQEHEERNQEAKLLATFWELMLKTKTGEFARSPFLDLKNAIRRDGKPTEACVYMVWSDDIHKDWHANTYIMDATMNDKIVQRFYPQMRHSLVDAKRSSNHTYIKQITDKRISKSSFVPNEHASKKDQTTQQNNLERIRLIIEVAAREFAPGKLLAIGHKGLEEALLDTAGKGKTPEMQPNVELEHFKNHAGRNDWRAVRVLITIGRTEPGVRALERRARALFGVDIIEIEPDERGVPRWPVATRYIKLRNGTSVPVECSMHPDPQVEVVRWQACEAELLQATGRGRGDERTADKPLLIIILTNVPLPIVVDEVATWKEIQPTYARIMWSRGIVPASPRDAAELHDDMFASRRAAESALQREAAKWFEKRDHTQTPIYIDYLIGVCVSSTSITYRKTGSRGGPPSRALYNPGLIPDPAARLAERLGPITVVNEPTQQTQTESETIDE